MTLTRRGLFQLAGLSLGLRVSFPRTLTPFEQLTWMLRGGACIVGINRATFAFHRNRA